MFDLDLQLGAEELFTGHAAGVGFRRWLTVLMRRRGWRRCLGGHAARGSGRSQFLAVHRRGHGPVQDHGTGGGGAMRVERGARAIVASATGRGHVQLILQSSKTLATGARSAGNSAVRYAVADADDQGRAPVVEAVTARGRSKLVKHMRTTVMRIVRISKNIKILPANSTEVVVPMSVATQTATQNLNSHDKAGEE